MKFSFKNILLFIAIILCFAVMATVLNGYGNNAKELTYDQVISYLDEGRVASIVIQSDGATMKLSVRELDDQGNAVAKDYIYRLSSYVQLETIEEKALASLASGKPEDQRLVSYNYEAPKETPWIVSYLPYILIGVGLIGLVIFISRSSKSGGRMNSFSRAKTKTADDAKNPVKFADVAGADEEKEELKEVVEFLKAPEKFVRLGARIPRGVLLVGPPGTGKTLLAKAVAGEAGVPFYSISGSDFVEMYVGVGASRVRDLFDTARKSPASIIFIDEIDAVGRQRGTGLGGGHDEREQTLNQLLVEMDGFGTHEGVIVMAATNRPDILDPALLRPGRFDRQVTVNYPDLVGREAILRVHVRNKPLEGNVDLQKIAQSTAGFTGADLANLLNEAALLAARMGKNLIGMEEIEKATLKVMVGTEKKTSRLSEREKRNTAYHEAGHAILSHLLPTQDPVRRISIIPAGRALGYTLSVPEQDKFSVYKSELCEQIAMLLGGRAAEEIVFGDISGGASNDIQRATHIAQNMVTRYGMSEKLGTVLLGGDHSDAEVFLGRDFGSSKNYSDETAHLIDNEIKRFIDEGYALAKKVLTENMDKLHFIAEYLTKYEVMDGEQFLYAMENDGVTDEKLLSMIDKRRRQSDEENRIAKEESDAAAEETNDDIPEMPVVKMPESEDSPTDGENADEDK
ncbi:MAG: ATP-dependent zinc metalloprotease FtsH [Ruminococcaceae bacterium]|nr:ATP-dependent zinc metalloprotease FtsH [Oscillospiraceae bacterium]